MQQRYGGPEALEVREIDQPDLAGNEVLVRTVSSLFDARHSPLSEKLRGHFENESTWGAVPDEHRVILEALESHDPIQAQASMQRHLKMSLERVIAGQPHGQRR